MDNQHNSPQNLNRQDAVWDYFQNEDPDKFLGSLPRLEFLMQGLTPGQKILNIGVGSGMFEEMALQRGLDIYAMDPVTKSIEGLRARLGLSEEKAKVGYGEQIPFEDNTFDVVIATEVLEHLTPESTAATLGEIRRILKPSGIFKGTVPAREDLSQNIVVCPDCSKRFHRWGHEQSFTIESIRNLLAQYFHVQAVEEKLFIPFNILNAAGRMEGMFRLMMARLGRKMSGQNVYFQAQKRT